MPRTRALVPPDAIRIEDEVWQDAFMRREPSRSRAVRRLHAIEGGVERAGAPEPVGGPLAVGAVLAPPLLADPAPSGAVLAPPRPGAARTTRTAAPPSADSADAASSTAPPNRARSAARPPGTALPGRRTVTIQGRGAERNLPWPDSSRRRPPRRAYERAGFRPDRWAMWAVLLGILLLLVAVASGHS